MKALQLKVERELRGWSQAKVAEAVGTNARTVIRWEQGQTIPYPYYREQLCTLFGKNARELGLLADVEEDALSTNEKEKPQGVMANQAPTMQPALHAPESPLFDPAIPVVLRNACSLVGRKRLLVDMEQQLRAGGREVPQTSFPTLIALQGLPGMGKTSLAAALTTEQTVRDHFRDGILWAGLGQDPDVLSHLARWGKLLGVTPAEVENVNSRESWGRALRTAIGSRRMLLVIDDAWNVEDALAFQVGGAQCAHLLTTRLPQVAFAFAKEGTLAVPELEDADGLALLACFVPHLIQQEGESAHALVRAVGGSPLALTLMGNYLAAQAFTGQARRLRAALLHLRDTEQRLRLSVPVAPGERPPCLPADAPLSLYAAIAVSDQRLTAPEHAALCALAVFPPKPNSFSEEAALTVSDAPVETLDALWDTGLLESSGPGRYTLHQTIADYAHAQEPAREAQQRLVKYMLQYVQAHEQDYEALEREQSTILAALEAAVTLDLSQALVQVVIALVSFMRVRGHYALADRLLLQALQATREDVVGRMHVLRHLAAFAELRGDYCLAERYSQEGLHLARQMGGQSDAESALLTTLGLVAYQRGQYPQARDRFEEGLRLARTFGDPERICTLLIHLGRVLHYQGNYPEAEVLYLEGRTLAEGMKQRELMNLLLIYLGATALLQGEYTQAQEHYEEALALARSLGHREHLDAVMNDMGIIAYHRGDFERATAYFLEGLALARQIGHRADSCLLLSNLGAAAVDQGDYIQAVRYLQEGIELARQLENRNRLTFLLATLGSALGHQENYEQANTCFNESLELARSIGSPWYIYSALLERGEIHLKSRRLGAAAAAFDEILAHESGAKEEPELMANARYGLARIAALRGKMAEAMHLGQESAVQLEKMGHHKARKVRDWLQSLPQLVTRELALAGR